MVVLDAVRAVPLRREVPRRACPEAQEGRAWLPAVRVLCVVPLRREVPRRACLEAQEGRAWLPVVRVLCVVPLRREVPRRACPEAHSLVCHMTHLNET